MCEKSKKLKVEIFSFVICEKRDFGILALGIWKANLRDEKDRDDRNHMKML